MMAIACVVLVLAITTLSAFIRLSRAGLGCQPWPQCYHQQLREAAGVAPAAIDATVAGARIAHRISAVAALLLIIAMVMTTLAAVPIRRREGRLALVLLALALFLAVLGRWTADTRLPAVVLANLLGGFAMFAVSCRLLAATTRPPPAAAAVSRTWLALAGGLLVAQIALGGMVSAAHAGLSCPQLATCDVAALSWQALNPWREPAWNAADPVNAAGALLHLLHRAASVLLALVLLPLGIAAWRRGRAAGAALLALLGLQLVAGAVLVVAGLPLALALAHNMLAALLLAPLVSLWPRRPAALPAAGARAQANVSGSPAASSAR